MSEWLKWQIEYLLDNYNRKTNLQIGKHIEKSESAVAQKLSYLKVKRSISYLETVRDLKRREMKLLFDSWDEMFKLPPKG